MTGSFVTSLVVVCICFNAGTLVAGLVTCPPDSNTTKTSLFLPHEEDCQKFYVCHGTPVLLSCPEPLKFDSVTKKCVAEAEATCPAKICPDNVDHLIPNPYDCAKFIRCVNGLRFDFECAEGTIYDSTLEVCNHVFDVVCNVIDREISDCKADDLPDHPSNYRFFPTCIDKETTKQKCLGGLFYNREKKYCEWSDFDLCLSSRFAFANAEDCHAYYTVDKGAMSVGKCPPSEYFDTTTSQCSSQPLSTLC